MKNKILRYLYIVVLTIVGTIFCSITVSATTPEFRADDVQQKIVLTTSMLTYNGTAGYAIHTLGYLIDISSGSTSKTVFLEGGVDYHQLSYSVIIAEFNTEHGGTGKTLAENYFYNYNGTMTLNTVLTLWQKGGLYSSVYNDYKCTKGGKLGCVQAKINDSSNVDTPSKEVYASNWTSQIKIFPVRFWDWSQKSYCWSYYATRMNNCKTSVYTLTPSTFTADTVKNYPTPYYASDWQNAAMLCEFGPTNTPAFREYYKRTIVRQNPTNFKVSEIQANSSITESGTVKVFYANDHTGKGTQTVPTNLSLSNGSNIDLNLTMNTDLHTGYWVTYTVFGYSEGSEILAATINGGTNGSHTFSEITYSDNVGTKAVNVQFLRNFGTSGLKAFNAQGEQVTSSSSAKLMENTTCMFSVNWINYSNVAQNNVKCEVYLDDVLIYTDYINFSGGYQAITKTYTRSIGWGTNNRVLKTRINYAAKDSETDSSDNESVVSFPVKEYRDFTISNLIVSTASVYENESVIVTCRTDNLNLLKTYNNIPVELVYNGQVVATQYVSFSPYGIGNHSFKFNVGSGIGQKSIYARINWSDRNSEVNTVNNQTASINITVSSQVDTGISLILPNSSYRAGTEVITSYRVSNHSGQNLTPGDKTNVYFNVNYYNSYGLLVDLVDLNKDTIIPANDSNLVYFKWTIPENMAGCFIYLNASVSTNFYDGNTSNNNYNDLLYIYSSGIAQTPDTKYESVKPSGWMVNPLPNEYSDTATWSEWSYSGGEFIKTVYGIRISTELIITPDSNSPSAEYINGQWNMKSGYGYMLSLLPSMTSVSDTVYPGSTAYTAVQRAYALFPEFSYSEITGKYRSLQLVSDMFQFHENPYANGQRLHFTPIWFPDGNYIVSCYLYDYWTPAGMLSALVNSDVININGSAYDDYYIGK